MEAAPAAAVVSKDEVDAEERIERIVDQDCDESSQEAAQDEKNDDRDRDPATSSQSSTKTMRGVFIMCSTTKEQRATSEALTLLNHYADVWEEQKNTKKETLVAAIDLLDDLRKEVAGLRSLKQKRFVQRQTNVKGILHYIYHSSWQSEGPDPVEFVLWMMERMKAAQEYGRFISRIVPLQTVGNSSNLLKLALPLLQANFPKSNPSSFEIEFACRHNSAFSRREVQTQLIEMGGLGYPHFVSHTMPQKTILVEIVNKIAGVSVVSRYYSLARFNVQQQVNKATVKAEANKKNSSHAATLSSSSTVINIEATPTAPPPAPAPAAAASQPQDAVVQEATPVDPPFVPQQDPPAADPIQTEPHR